MVKLLGYDGIEPVLVVGHNAAFDARMLHAEFERLPRRTGAPDLRLPPLRLLDTATLATAAHLPLAGRRLADLLAALGMQNPAEHTAHGDELVTGLAALRLLEMLTAGGVASLDPFIVDFDPSQLAAPRANGTRPGRELSDKHATSHYADLSVATERNQALAVCLAERCDDMVRRLADAVTSAASANEVVAWALQMLETKRLDRRRKGQLLYGIGWAVRQAENPNYARAIYNEKLGPLLRRLGKCSPTRQCGRGMFTRRTCRFVSARQMIIAAFVYDEAKVAAASSPDGAKTFLPVPEHKQRGRPAKGWYHELVAAGDVEAAGYGAYLAASVRKGQRNPAWALRLCEHAWGDGCRDPYLANLYASLTARLATASDRAPLSAAMSICVDALSAQRHRQGGSYAALVRRRTCSRVG